MAERPPPWAWLLGREPRMRERMAGVLAYSSVYLVCCALAFAVERMGYARAGLGWIITGLTVVQLGVFIGLMRSGWSQRLRDPIMLLPQNVAAAISIAVAYAMVEPVYRGTALIIVSLITVFGLYTLTPGRAVATAFIVAAIFAVPMLVMPQIDPQWFPPGLELVRFELMAGTLPALALVARRVAGWRERLRRQKRELKQALEQARVLATRDALTGLVNRRHMQDRLDELATLARNGGAGFALALIDLDHFKRINDSNGHRVGDEVLRGFADACPSVLRASDVLARWGGEEFLILFPDASIEEAHVALTRLKARLAHQPVSASHPELRLSFSAGVARHKPHHSLDHTLERADRALYQAKDEGRNRARLAQDTTTPSELPADLQPHE